MKTKITRRQLFKRIGVIGLAAKLGFISKTEASEVRYPTKEEVEKESKAIMSRLLINKGKNGITEGGPGYYIVGNGRVILGNGEDMFPPMKTKK